MATKPGKYAAFKKLYPKVPVEATVFEKMREVLDAQPDGFLRVRDLTNTELKDLYVAARKAKDALDTQIAVLDTQIAAYTLLFINRMEEDDVTSFPFTDGVRLGSSIEPRPVTVDKEALLKWVHDTGQEELLTLNAMTLTTIVKQRLLEGESIPPGVEVYMQDRLRVTGLNNKGESNE